MSDSYTHVTNESWTSRLGGSFKGIIFGLFLFVAAFPLLFWNEGRAIQTEKSLEEGAASVISIDSQSIVPVNEGKLVHLSDMATTEEELQDTQFKVKLQAINLQREVLVYQWQEHSESTTEKEMGGGTKTTTRYTYSKIWSSALISSSSFKHPQGHTNPGQKTYQNKQWYANTVTIGKFKLNSSLIHDISGADIIPLTENNIPSSVSATISADEIFVGNNLNEPIIGDTRIRFSAVKPKQVSIIAKQTNNSFTPYKTSVGNTIQLLTLGQISAQEMFADELSKNTFITWGLRFLGFMVMMIGLSLVLKPLSVLGDVIPFIGNIIEFGTGLLSAIIAFSLSLITIAIAWFFYRPILTIGLISIVVGIVYLLKKKINKSVNSTNKQPPVIENNHSSSKPPPPPPTF